MTTPESLEPARFGAAALALLVQLLIVAALVAGFAPAISPGTVATALTSVMIPIQPLRAPALHPATAARLAAASGPVARRAEPVARAAPRTLSALAMPTGPAAATADVSLPAGAGNVGMGTGAGGPGNGPGAGGSGMGDGGGGGSRPVKIAGDIVSARDYPPASRDLRIGGYVILALTVSSDGRVSACRVEHPSRDAAADAITCTLATRRFRFRPGTAADGRPVESSYGWKQSWHY